MRRNVRVTINNDLSGGVDRLSHCVSCHADVGSRRRHLRVFNLEPIIPSGLLVPQCEATHKTTVVVPRSHYRPIAG